MHFNNIKLNYHVDAKLFYIIYWSTYMIRVWGKNKYSLFVAEKNE